MCFLNLRRNRSRNFRNFLILRIMTFLVSLKKKSNVDSVRLCIVWYIRYMIESLFSKYKYISNTPRILHRSC